MKNRHIIDQLDPADYQDWIQDIEEDINWQYEQMDKGLNLHKGGEDGRDRTQKD
jgi:hypothetical protein